MVMPSRPPAASVIDGARKITKNRWCNCALRGLRFEACKVEDARMTKKAIALAVSLVGAGLAQVGCSAPDPGVISYGSPTPNVSSGAVDAGGHTAPPQSSGNGDAGSTGA